MARGEPTPPLSAPNTGAASRPQVFISYSMQPEENARFVRDLAGRLRVAGFNIWLDEEQMPPGAEIESSIKEAIGRSDVGLFIVTARWKERSWTQYELRLFNERPQSRRVAVVRETNLGDLGPYLSGLNKMSWISNDPQPDACFWQIYCGIKGIPLTPRENWEREGRRVGSGARHPEPEAPMPKPRRAVSRRTESSQSAVETGRLKLPLAGIPIGHVTGKEGVFLVSDRGEWIGVSVRGELHAPIARLTNHSVALCPRDQLVVGLYEPMVARLSGGRWEYLPQEAPVFCFESTPHGIVAGTAAGKIGLIVAERGLAPLRIRDSVMALAFCQTELVIIGNRGMFGKCPWPAFEPDPFRWIATEKLGRPVGFFPAAESRRIGIYSSNRIGLLDPATQQVALCREVFDEGIRQVVFLGAQTRPYAVVTDNGRLVLLDAGLGSARTVHFAGETPVRGCATASWGVAITWTAAGELWRVSSEAVLEPVAGDGVTFAYCPDSSGANIHIVRVDATRRSDLEVFALA